MTIRIRPSINVDQYAPVQQGGIQAQLQKSGRLPPVTISITSIETGQTTFVDKFLSYQFTNSVLIPVNTFNFVFVAPDDPAPVSAIINEGDLIALFANGIQVATGIIDTVETEVDMQYGEKITISGRDLLAQLEDQDAISLDSTPFWGNALPIDAIIAKLIIDTRIQGFINRGCSKKNRLFATEPGESKLTALQRHIDSLNCIAYSSPTGKIIVGKPTFSAGALGDVVFSKKNRNTTNCINMKVVRSSAQIPNFVIPIWTGQEIVQNKVGKQQGLPNAAAGPARLFRLGHRLVKSVVVSTPMGGTPQDLADVNLLKSSSRAGNSIDIQAYAKREIAKWNIKELMVQTTMIGHYNDSAQPYLPDQIYNVRFDRGGDFEVNDSLYLFQADYTLSEDSGQRTQLYFCKKGTIVADTTASAS